MKTEMRAEMTRLEMGLGELSLKRQNQQREAANFAIQEIRETGNSAMYGISLARLSALLEIPLRNRKVAQRDAIVETLEVLTEAFGKLRVRKVYEVWKEEQSFNEILHILDMPA